jgi:very-short-patch-repair endonuclease
VSAIDHLVNQGELTVVHRGVYLLAGAVLTTAAREFAAVLACGDGAALSHGSAAYRLDLLPYPAHYATLDVTLTRRAGAKPGIRTHHTAAWEPGDTFVLEGLRTTTPRRTLLDLAAVAPGRPLERALAIALGTNRASRNTLLAHLDRHRYRRGAAALRAILDAGPSLTRSEAEELLLELIRDSSLPEPQTNARVGRFEVDFFWPEARLVVEVDGWRFHGDRESIERDRARDAQLAALGYRVTGSAGASSSTSPR